MDDNIKKKFEFIKSDLSCNDINGATLSDIVTIATECFKHHWEFQGANLLITYGRIIEARNEKRNIAIREFNIHLNDAEKILS